MTSNAVSDKTFLNPYLICIYKRWILIELKRPWTHPTASQDKQVQEDRGHDTWITRTTPDLHVFLAHLVFSIIKIPQKRKSWTRMADTSECSSLWSTRRSGWHTSCSSRGKEAQMLQLVLISDLKMTTHLLNSLSPNGQKSQFPWIVIKRLVKF